MNSPGTELDPALGGWVNVETDGSSFKERGSYVLSDPAGTPMSGGPPSAVSLPVEAPPSRQQGVHTMMVNPQSFGFPCPYHFSQSQTGSDYPQSQQYHLLPGPGPGLSNSSHVTSLSAPWFPYEPGLHSSTMAWDALSPVAGLFVPQTVDPQKGPTELTPHYAPPVLCNEEGGGQEMLVKPYSNWFGTPDKLACPLSEYRDQAPSMQPQAPPQRRPCHCARSQCLKLYCDCFANGLMCNNCECSNCFNNPEHVMARQKAIQLHSGRNPDAFKTKIVSGRSGEVKGWHKKGCSCKRSGCLKNYCECYEAKVMCTSSCKCSGCRNFENKSETGKTERTIRDKENCLGSVITHDVVEAVCGCLLARAEKAEREAQSSTQAEQEVLVEFGQCMEQIVKAMFE